VKRGIIDLPDQNMAELSSKQVSGELVQQLQLMNKVSLSLGTLAAVMA
jgi:hypothetical protein